MNNPIPYQAAVLCILFASFVFAICVNASATEVELDAPFKNEVELRDFSELLVNHIGRRSIQLARDVAVANSHLDDEVVQRNIAETFELLPKKLVSESMYKTQYVQTSKFGRSFIRHQYAFENSGHSMRCMLTYRRKTDGWRLNQVWCF
ncbi:MAG: hypothetical protein ACU84Q_12160 [Gammaproteobacteria bacterium]